MHHCVYIYIYVCVCVCTYMLDLNRLLWAPHRCRKEVEKPYHDPPWPTMTHPTAVVIGCPSDPSGSEVVELFTNGLLLQQGASHAKVLGDCWWNPAVANYPGILSRWKIPGFVSGISRLNPVITRVLNLSYFLNLLHEFLESHHSI